MASEPMGVSEAPVDGERHGQWQYIATWGYWVYMVSYDHWDDCAGLCEELCQRYGIGVWVDAARPGDYHPAAHVSNTEAIRAIDANSNEICEDCGHAPCDCDQMRAAEELLYGDDADETRSLSGDSFDEPHGLECCCETCGTRDDTAAESERRRWASAMGSSR